MINLYTNINSMFTPRSPITAESVITSKPIQDTRLMLTSVVTTTVADFIHYHDDEQITEMDGFRKRKFSDTGYNDEELTFQIEQKTKYIETLQHIETLQQDIENLQEDIEKSPTQVGLLRQNATSFGLGYQESKALELKLWFNDPNSKELSPVKEISMIDNRTDKNFAEQLILDRIEKGKYTTSEQVTLFFHDKSTRTSKIILNKIKQINNRLLSGQNAMLYSFGAPLPVEYQPQIKKLIDLINHVLENTPNTEVKDLIIPQFIGKKIRWSPTHTKSYYNSY